MLTIVTPCSRQDNLQTIRASIRFDKITEWIIVYDTTKGRTYPRLFRDDPQIRELDTDNYGISGNAQRNHGASQVKDGLIYFLDDDNIVHPHFWDLVDTFDPAYFYTFDQRFFVPDTFRKATNFVFKGNEPAVRKIDTAMFVVPAKMWIPWTVDRYDADGIFIEDVHVRNPSRHKYIPEVAAYYNYVTDSYAYGRQPTSGLQNILFISDVEPPYYPLIDDHYTWIPVVGHCSFERLSELYHKYKPMAFYTYLCRDTSALQKTFQIRKRWTHLTELSVNIDVCPLIFGSMFPGAHQFDATWPLMSIITTTFNSGHKLLRPHRSLIAQSYPDWEWIIWDDSKDDVTYKQLLDMQAKDLRIRVFKAPAHSGYIGEMKRLAGSLACGEFVVEIDHDDDFHPNLLRWIRDAAAAHPDAGFFYTDCAELMEDTYEPAIYGEFFGMGYEMHVFNWSPFHGRYIPSVNAAQPNGATLSHIVGVPNHVRAWRTAVYDRIGRHNQHLSVADDYELLLRSYIDSPFCHIRACGYYQYRNRDGNFTFHRNALIQHNVAHIYQHYKGRLPARDWSVPLKEQWRVDARRYPVTHRTWVPPELVVDVTVALMNPCLEEVEEEFAALKASGKRFHIFVVGPLPDIADDLKPFVSWWDMKSADPAERREFVKRFLHISGELVFH
jgi:glycosyltransferase involved in cell wall biosynthesis